MRVGRLGQHRQRRSSELEWHRDDFDFVIEFGANQFDDLANGEHLGVANIEDLAGGCIGFVDRQQQRFCEVFCVAVVMQREAVVGHDDASPTIEHPANHAPLARCKLVRAIHIWVTHMGGAVMRFEHCLFGTNNAETLFVFFGKRNRRTAFGRWYWQPARLERPRVHPPAIGRNSADRQEASGASDHQFGDAAQPAVHHDGRIEGVPLERRAERCNVVGVGVNVRDFGGCFVVLVNAAMKNRDVMAAGYEATNEREPCGSGTADDQYSFDHGRDSSTALTRIDWRTRCVASLGSIVRRWRTASQSRGRVRLR